MKKFLLFLFFVFLAIPRKALANEGVVNLRGNGNSACFASSIYIDGNYRVNMTCRGLVIAISPEKNRYVTWFDDSNGKFKVAGEIVNGKLSTIIRDRFTKLIVTSEETDYPTTPSGDLVLSGVVTAIDFGKNIPSEPVVIVTAVPSTTVATPTPTPTQKANVSTGTNITGNIKTTTAQSGLGSALSMIFKIAMFGFGLLLVVVGVFSFLQRRRSL